MDTVENWTAGCRILARANSPGHEAPEIEWIDSEVRLLGKSFGNARRSIQAEIDAGSMLVVRSVMPNGEDETQTGSTIRSIRDERDRHWRAWLERLKLKFGHADSWARIERDDPPPDKS